MSSNTDYIKTILNGVKSFVGKFFENNIIKREALPEGYPYKGEVPSDTFTWDGNTEGLVGVVNAVDDFSEGYYKVSDDVFSNEQIKEFVVSYYERDYEDEWRGAFRIGEIWRYLEEDGMVSDDAVVVLENSAVVRKAGVIVNGLTFPECGLYIYKSTEGGYAEYCTTSITIPGYTGFTKIGVKTIDEELLPDSVKVKGVSSWNDLADRPFGYPATLPSDTLTWDFNCEGLERNNTFVRISTVNLTAEDLANGVKVRVGNTDYEFTRDDMSAYSDESTAISLGPLHRGGVVVFKPFYSAAQGNFPTEGIYFDIGFIPSDRSRGYALTIPGYTGFTKDGVQPIDQEHLPRHLQFGYIPVPSDTLTWNGNTDPTAPTFTWHKVSDVLPTREEVGTESSCICEGVLNEKMEVEDLNGGGLYLNGGEVLIIPPSAVGIPIGGDIGDDVVFTEPGIYFIYGTTSFTIPGYTGFTQTEVKPIDPKLLPEGYPYKKTKNKVISLIATEDAEENVTGGTITNEVTGKIVNFTSADVTDNSFVRIADPISLNDFKTIVATFSDGFTWRVSDMWDMTLSVSNDDVIVSMGFMCAMADGVVDPAFGITFEKAGLYVDASESQGDKLTISWTETEVVKTIDEDLLPDSVKGGGGVFVLVNEYGHNGEKIYSPTHTFDELSNALLNRSPIVGVFYNYSNTTGQEYSDYMPITRMSNGVETDSVFIQSGDYAFNWDSNGISIDGGK